MSKLDLELPGLCTRRPTDSPSWLQRKPLRKVGVDPGDALLREFEKPITPTEEELMVNQFLSYLNNLLAEGQFTLVNEMLEMMDPDVLGVTSLTRILALIDPHKAQIPNRASLLRYMLDRLKEEEEWANDEE